MISVISDQIHFNSFHDFLEASAPGQAPAGALDASVRPSSRRQAVPAAAAESSSTMPSPARRLSALHQQLEPSPAALDGVNGRPLRAAKPEGLSLKEMRDVWSQDLTESVLPFWSTHGPDEEYGGYYTCLDRNGEVYDDRKFMQVFLNKHFPPNLIYPLRDTSLTNCL